MNVKNEQKIE